MDDLISREALKNAIATARTNYNTCPDYNELFNYFCDLVSAMSDEMPAVDAVEVVRCKDCKNHGKCTFEDTFITVGINDGYCRVGAKMDEEQE